MKPTRFDSLFAAYYGRRFSMVEARLWGRISFLFSFVEAVTGTVAFSAWLSKSPDLASTMGLVIAISVTANQAIKPKEKSMAQEFMKQKFGAIIEDESKLSDDELASRVAALQNEPGSEIEALRDPVYVQTAQELGCSHAPIPLTFWQKFINAIA
jgi:uncharacterized small protein (DUF1192 family)